MEWLQPYHPWLDYLNPALTLLGLVVLCFYTWYTKCQVKLTEEALAESRTSSEAALAETRKSNEATKNSNEIAKRSLILGRRAWLILEIENDFSDPESWFTITIKNIGAVPAEVSSVEVYADWLKALPAVLEFPEKKREKRMIIPPGKQSSTVTSSIDLDLSHKDYKREFLFACCRIEYSDVFKNRWITESGWSLTVEDLHGRNDWYTEQKYSKLE
jgi:hypothetical protein